MRQSAFAMETLLWNGYQIHLKQRFLLFSRIKIEALDIILRSDRYRRQLILKFVQTQNIER